jgi:hypothetical protein
MDGYMACITVELWRCTHIPASPPSILPRLSFQSLDFVLRGTWVTGLAESLIAWYSVTSFGAGCWTLMVSLGWERHLSYGYAHALLVLLRTGHCCDNEFMVFLRSGCGLFGPGPLSLLDRHTVSVSP